MSTGRASSPAAAPASSPRPAKDAATKPVQGAKLPPEERRKRFRVALDAVMSENEELMARLAK